MENNPLRDMVKELRPQLLDNPMVATSLDEYATMLTPEDVTKLRSMLPLLTEAFERDDYIKFRDTLQEYGWGNSAPYIYAMLKENT